jgi:hypothetical protein
MLTLQAKRTKLGVILFNENNNQVAMFPKSGYQPTRATKTVTLNCWKYNLIW